VTDGPFEEFPLDEEPVTELTDRGLGDLLVQSNVRDVDERMVLSQAAVNLLTKAERAMVAGDRQQVDRLLDRALQLPRDELAEADAALQAAHMMVFNTLVDAVESSDDTDSRWLDAAEAALPRCSDDAREHLLETLRVVASDHELDRPDLRRIRRLAPGQGLVDGVGDVMLTLTDADKPTVRRLVVELLEAVGVLRSELGARGVETVG